ncbi:MAG: hypothetical protein ACK40D_02645 [Cyanobacteriota bacterium]|jgi:hypothetical protein
MTWTAFLQSISERHEHALTAHELDVFLCLREHPGQSKQELLDTYQQLHSPIEDEAFTQRLRTIYRKFNITGRGYKLPQLHRYLQQQYQQWGQGFGRLGLQTIHPGFPADRFAAALEQLIGADDGDDRQVAILQTFAPNLDQYRAQLSRCLLAGVSVRILLAWPYSLAASLREAVLKRYADEPLADDFGIQASVIANLETLEATIRGNAHAERLQVRLYDTLPSMALYRAGHTLLAAPFLHGALAIHTFQLELDLQASDPLITGTLLNDFELMWTVARPFLPDPDRNWRSSLRILFTDK